MAASASRMAARSTTQGTPVKSCNSTRAGMKLISLATDPPRAARDIFDIGGGHAAAVFLAQQVFQQDFGRERQARNVADALFFKAAQAKDAVIGITGAQRGRGSE